MSEGPDLRVGEANQPHNESVQHVLIVENAVLALKDDVVDEIHKVTLRTKKCSHSFSHPPSM